MRKLISFLLILAFSFQANAQKRNSLTMPYEGGTLTFQYYEKDGIKIPDGPMEFTRENYSEKGENNDGYREGCWISKNGSTTKTYNFKKGMLEGPTTVEFKTTDKYLLKNSVPYQCYNFHNGRLFGENKIVLSVDTIYCNFGEDGKRIGIWRLVDPKKTIVIEYNVNPSLQNAYELDVLGQKKSIEVGSAEMKFFMKFLSFNDIFRKEFFKYGFEKRPELPTLCENKYGYVDAW